MHQPPNLTQNALNRVIRVMVYLLPFLLCFAYFWRNYPLSTSLLGEGDLLEVLWGIEWYHHAFTNGASPFFYPLIFHPEGWPVGILAHTPLLFTIAQPFYLIGGEIFAYNLLAIIPLVIAYAGALLFFRHLTTSRLILIAVSLGYTFITMRSSRAGGHLHILWGTSMLPLLGNQLILWFNRDEDQPFWHANMIWTGIWWGAMISFSLYSVFLAPIMFFLLERKLLAWKRIGQLVAVGLIALVVGSSAILPYYLATRANPIRPALFEELARWGASLNALFMPSVFHPIPVVKAFSNALIDNRVGEESIFNFGLVTLVIIILGFFFRPQSGRRSFYGHLLVLVVGLLFALGPVLKINNIPLQVDIMAPVNEMLWSLGHRLKPDVFHTPTIEPGIAGAIPLPAYLIVILVPFWEGARVTARFAFVALMGAFGVVASSLDRFPRWLQVGLLLLWFVEILPPPTGANRYDLTELHPAYAWLVEQPLEAGEGIVDVQGGIIMNSAYPLYLSWQTQVPTAASTGSFRPEQNHFLGVEVGQWSDQAPSYLANLLNAYGIRFVVVHQDGELSAEMWAHLVSDEASFSPVGCFEPEPAYRAPWDYPICVASVESHSTLNNLFPISGFAAAEPWGVWVTEPEARFRFVATGVRDQRLTFEAFPVCVDDGLGQSVSLSMHGNELYTHTWSDCEPIQATLVVPARSLAVGWNEVDLFLSRVARPSDFGDSGDNRTLGIGFSRLTIEP